MPPLPTPKFTYDDLRYLGDDRLFMRARGLFEAGKVGEIETYARGYTAIVTGTHPYKVSIESKNYEYGSCNCYMGEQELLCKHMIALGLKVLSETKQLPNQEEENQPLTLPEAKIKINAGMKKLKPYNGPSRIWFTYQADLCAGCDLIENTLNRLPPSLANARYVWGVIKRMDKKLFSGIDDSDGTVWQSIVRLFEILTTYAQTSADLKSIIQKFPDEYPDFEFKEELMQALGLRPKS